MRESTTGCPYDVEVRATKCQQCCSTTAGLPPCARTWLAERLDVRVVAEPGKRRAA